MWAALNGYPETVNVLVQCGANLNAQNKEGLTALMIAVIKGQTTTVIALVEGHADVNVQENVSPAGESCGLYTACVRGGPQPWTCMYRNSVLAEACFLAAVGGLPTPSMAAHCLAPVGLHSSFEVLVGAGGNVLLKNKVACITQSSPILCSVSQNGVTALDVARIPGKEEVCEVLFAVQPEETSTPPPDQQTTQPTTHVHASIEPTPSAPSSPGPREHTPQALRSLVNISVQRITDVYQALQRRLKSTPTKKLLQQEMTSSQDERENIHDTVHIITQL